jgi:flagellar FliL protein
VNPAGTNGQKLLLTSLTFDVENEPSQKTIKEKEMIVKDIIISTLSSKSLIELSQVGYKDSLKIELANNLMASLKNVKVQSVYFTKYIIQ